MSSKPRQSWGVRIFQRSLSALKEPDLNPNKNVLSKDTETTDNIDSALNVTTMNRKQFWNPPRRGHGRHGYAMNRRCKAGRVTAQEHDGDGDTRANSQQLKFTRQKTQTKISPGNKHLKKEHSIEEDWNDDLIDLPVNTDSENIGIELKCDHSGEPENVDNKGLNEASDELYQNCSEFSGFDLPRSGLLQSTPKKSKSNTATRSSTEVFNDKETLNQPEETSSQFDVGSEAKDENIDIQDLEESCKELLRIAEPEDHETPTIRGNESSLQTGDRSKTAKSKTCVPENAKMRTLSPRKADHGCVNSKDSTSVCKQVENIHDKPEFRNTNIPSKLADSNLLTNFSEQERKSQPDRKKYGYTAENIGHRPYYDDPPRPYYDDPPLPPRFQNRGKYSVPKIHSTPKYKGPYYSVKSYKGLGRRERVASGFRGRNRYFVKDGPLHYTESVNRSLRNVSSEDWESEILHKAIELSKDLDTSETESESETDPHCRNNRDIVKETHQEIVASKDQIRTTLPCGIIMKPYLPPPPPSDDENDISVDLASIGIADQVRAEVYTPEIGLEPCSKTTHDSLDSVHKSSTELRTEHVDELKRCQSQTSENSDNIYGESELSSMFGRKKENSECQDSNVVDTVLDCDFQAAGVPNELSVNNESLHDGDTDHCVGTGSPDIYNTDFSDIAVISQDEGTNRKKKLPTKRVANSDTPNINYTQGDLLGGRDHDPSHQYTDPWFQYSNANGYRDMYHRNMWANYDWYNYYYGGYGAYNHCPFPAPFSSPPCHMWERPGFGYPILPEFPMGRPRYPGMMDSCRDKVPHRMDTGEDTVKSQLPMQENWENEAMVGSKETSLRKNIQDNLDHQQSQANHDSKNHDYGHGQIPKKGSNLNSDQSSNKKVDEKVKHTKSKPNSHQPRPDSSGENNDAGRQRKVPHCCCKPEQVQYLVWRACRCPEGIPPRLQKIYNSGHDEPSLDLGYQSYDSIEESGARCPLKSVMSHKAIYEEPFPLPNIQPHVFMLTTDSRPSDQVIQNSSHHSSNVSSQMQQSSCQRRQMDNTQWSADLRDDNIPPSRRVVDVAGKPDIVWDANNNNMPTCTEYTGDRDMCNNKPVEHMDHINLHNTQADQDEIDRASQCSEVAYKELPTDLTKSASHLASASASITRAGQTNTNLNSALNTFSEAIMAIGKTLHTSKEYTNTQETNTGDTCTRRDMNVNQSGRMPNYDERNVKSTNKLQRKVCMANMAGKAYDVENTDDSVDLRFVEDSSVCEADIDSDVSGDNRIIQHTMTQSSGSGLEDEDLRIGYRDPLKACDRNRNSHDVDMREGTKNSFPRRFDYTQRTPGLPGEMRRPYIPSEYRPRSHFLSSPPFPRLNTSPRQEHLMPRPLYGGSPGWQGSRPRTPPGFQTDMGYPGYQTALSSASTDLGNQNSYEQNSGRFGYAEPFDWRMNSWLKETEAKQKHVEPNQTSTQSAPPTLSDLSQISDPHFRADLHKVKHEAKTTLKVVEYSSSEDSYDTSDSEVVCHDYNDNRTAMNSNLSIGKHVAKKFRSHVSDCMEREFPEKSLEENTKLQAKNVFEKTVSSSSHKNRAKRLSQKVLKSFNAPDVPTSRVHPPATSQYDNTSISAKGNECKSEMPTPPYSVLAQGPPGARSMPPLPPFPASPFWGMYLPSNTSALSGQPPPEKSYSAATQTGIENKFSTPPVHKPPVNRRLMRRSWPVSGHYARSATSESDSEVHSPCLWDWKKTFKEFHSFGVKYIDTHCHLDFLFSREMFRGNLQSYMAKYPETFPDTFEGCVAVFCNPSTFNPNYGLWLEVAKESNVWIAMGCHPKMALDFTETAENGLRQCLKHDKCIALGEIGLDYSGTFWQHTDIQKKVFRKQLEMALEMNKPLVIHSRESENDCLSILKEMVPKDHKIHCHCFTAGYANAKLWTDAFPNLYIGITPLVTYPTATPSHNLARNIPLNRLLLETDAPYFVPRCIPKKDMSWSNPGLAVVVAKEVAKYQELPVAAVLRQCRLNTKFMYGI